MRDIFSKKGILFLVQVDHISGEIMGPIFDCLYKAGALNVQCLQTITKKNRPANIFLVDTPPDKADAIEKIIVNELDSTGWHKLDTEHRHVPVEMIYKEIKVVQSQCKFTFQVKGKQIKGIPESVRPEFSCCQELKEKIELLCGIDISLKQVYMKIQSALCNGEEAAILF